VASVAGALLASAPPVELAILGGWGKVTDLRFLLAVGVSGWALVCDSWPAVFRGAAGCKLGSSGADGYRGFW
jgi:hypothetical protein